MEFAVIIIPLLAVETKAQAASGDKVKHRLEQLDDMDEGSVKETLNLSQKDYVRKIDELNRSLVTAWDNDQRVKALKIAIQVDWREGKRAKEGGEEVK